MAAKGLVLGKGRRPEEVSTLCTDRARISRHIRMLVQADQQAAIAWLADCLSL
ncbi:hypothetical protein [Mesorhizobium sp. M0571]|uniref:hypothetical protein n=1 Tax=Mesorhizobium sp. M0571 TaxID=2956960 RepID=UPI0033377239